MSDPNRELPLRVRRWLWRYRPPDRLSSPPVQDKLLRERGRRLKMRAFARAKYKGRGKLPARVRLYPLPRLEFKQPFTLTRPSQIPRLRLTPRPPPPQPPVDRSAPLRLPVLHALLSFLFLAFLPSRLLSIPVALGLAAAVVFYLLVAANLAGYHLDFDK